LTGDIEKYGSGFLRIRNAMSLYPTMKMDFKEIGDGFMVTVSYTEQKTNTDVTEKGTEKVGEKVGEKLTENQQKILTIIAEKSRISASELAVIVGISKRKIEENISKLKSKGLLERVGADKGGYWKVKS